MRIERNYDGVPEQEDIALMPNGDYMFEITEVSDGYSNSGDPMPNICLRCIEDGECEGKKVWDNILIPEPDSAAHKIIGRTKRFLHAIREPYQGDFDVDTENWLNKTVEVKIGTDEYKGRKKNIALRYLISDKQQEKHDKSMDFLRPKDDEIEKDDFPF